MISCFYGSSSGIHNILIIGFRFGEGGTYGRIVHNLRELVNDTWVGKFQQRVHELNVSYRVWLPKS